MSPHDGYGRVAQGPGHWTNTVGRRRGKREAGRKGKGQCRLAHATAPPNLALQSTSVARLRALSAVRLGFPQADSLARTFERRFWRGLRVYLVPVRGAPGGEWRREPSTRWLGSSANGLRLLGRGGTIRLRSCVPNGSVVWARMYLYIPPLANPPPIRSDRYLPARRVASYSSPHTKRVP